MTTSSRYSRSAAEHERARRLLPGGVNSPARAIGAVGGVPFFAARGRGALLFDVDGNEYVDYVGAYGPLVLGHGDPRVVEAVHAALLQGTAFGAPTKAETELAERVVALYPSMEKVRFVSSGTEATMSAIRVARGFTERAKVIKFAGCYHGHADHLLVKAGSGALTFGQPSSGGVPEGSAADTLVADFNDLPGVRRLFEANPGRIACIILEPVVGNMGVVPPLPGFLEGLRSLCSESGTLLLFDEVMSGFRVALGGAQALYGVTPDLTCLGKVIGGGLPVGAYGGRADVMGIVAPDGPVYQAGTLSGNPLSMAAGIATLDAIGAPGVFERLVAATTTLCEGLRVVAREAGLNVAVQQVGSMFTVFLTGGGPAGVPVELRCLTDVERCDLRRFAAFFHGMRDRGVSLPPSQFEACFVSTAHDEAAIGRTLEAARDVFGRLA